eukprot:1189817-Prorocentrum_minimum.AAC.1
MRRSGHLQRATERRTSLMRHFPSEAGLTGGEVDDPAGGGIGRWPAGEFPRVEPVGGGQPGGGARPQQQRRALHVPTGR